MKPTRVEYRPGLGVIFKALATRWQFVHQLKYQADITLTLQYFIGAFNRGDRRTWSGIPLVQLTINVRSDRKYVPAKLINC